MNSVFIHTFDKTGAVHVRSLFSVAGATLHVYPLGAFPCAPPSGSSRAARPVPLQIESYCAVRVLPGPSRAVSELLSSSSAARPEPCSSRTAGQFENCCAVRELPLRLEPHDAAVTCAL